MSDQGTGDGGKEVYYIFVSKVGDLLVEEFHHFVLEQKRSIRLASRDGHLYAHPVRACL